MYGHYLVKMGVYYSKTAVPVSVKYLYVTVLDEVDDVHAVIQSHVEVD